MPNRRIFTLVEWEAILKEEVLDDKVEVLEDQEEVMKEAKQGELLVLRRTFNGFKGAKEGKRENIFHFRCTVQEKMFSLIIDGASCANIALLSMVGKLQPQSYGSLSPSQYSIAQSR